MNQTNVAKTLDIYKLFTRETDGINSFFELAKKFSKTELPTLQHAPTGLVETLESHLEDLKQGRTPNLKEGHIDKDKFKQTQKQMHGINIDQLSGESDSEEEDETTKTKGDLWDPFADIPASKMPQNQPKRDDAWDPFGSSNPTNQNTTPTISNNDPWNPFPTGNNQSNPFPNNQGFPTGNQNPFPTGNQPTGNQPTGNQPTGNQPTGNQPTGNQPTGNQSPFGNQNPFPTGNQPTGNQSPFGNQNPFPTNGNDPFDAPSNDPFASDSFGTPTNNNKTGNDFNPWG